MKPSKDLDEQIEDILANAIDYYISGNGVQPEAISRVKTLIEQREREARIDSLLVAKRRIYETDDSFELAVALGIIDSELKKLGWKPGETKQELDEILADKSGAVSYNQKQAILQWVSEAVIRGNEAAEDNIYTTEDGKSLWRYNEHNKAARNGLRAEQREILRKEGWKDED